MIAEPLGSAAPGLGLVIVMLGYAVVRATIEKRKRDVQTAKGREYMRELAKKEAESDEPRLPPVP
jgi:hypothetical protein